MWAFRRADSSPAGELDCHGGFQEEAAASRRGFRDVHFVVTDRSKGAEGQFVRRRQEREEVSNVSFQAGRAPSRSG